MCYTGSLDGAYVFQLHRSCTKVIKQAYASSKQERRDINIDFIHQSCPECLLQNAGCAKDNIFIARGLLCLMNCTFYPVADEDERRAFSEPLLRRMMSQDKSRCSRRMSAPGAGDIKRSASPDSRAVGLNTIFQDFGAFSGDLE